jgi:DNA-binding LacI/PurR family transcriptional regulator
MCWNGRTNNVFRPSLLVAHQELVVPDIIWREPGNKHLIGLQPYCLHQGPENWHTCRARLSGYQETLASHQLPFDPSLVQPGDWEIESGYAAAKNLLNLAERPTAIFAANDAMALGAIYAIQDAD